MRMRSRAHRTDAAGVRQPAAGPRPPSVLPDVAAGPPARSFSSERDDPGPVLHPTAPGLHLVATPIGNLGDITRRALAVLAAADIVACEDTRVTRVLLQAYGLYPRLIAYHDHNAETVRPELLAALAGGQTVALVSDAGTPLVSDPGYKLVCAAIDAGLPVTAAPGPSAPLAALLLSGLPPDRFLFAGFLPPRSAARRAEIDALAAVPATLLFFETAPRLAAALADLAARLGDRPAAVARELTKRHEEVRRGSLGALAAQYAAAGPPRGEIVVVVGPPVTRPQPDAADQEAALDSALRAALATQSLKAAVATVTASSGASRRLVYARALALTGTVAP